MAVQALYADNSTPHGAGALFVELFNEYHWIENPATLAGVFGDSPQVTDQTIGQEGFPIGAGSFLLKDPDGPKIFLMTNDNRYWIDSPAALEHYQFNGTVYVVDPADNVVAAWALKMTPEGQQISE